MSELVRLAKGFSWRNSRVVCRNRREMWDIMMGDGVVFSSFIIL